jgi:phage replication-related protein YjqB (UPF0714/DUF867 family)
MPGTAQEVLSILVSDHLLTQEDAYAVTTESLATGEAVEDILRRKRSIADAVFAKARAKSLSIPFVTLAGKLGGCCEFCSEPSPPLSSYPFNLMRLRTNFPLHIGSFDFQVIEFVEKNQEKVMRMWLPGGYSCGDRNCLFANGADVTAA